MISWVWVIACCMLTAVVTLVWFAVVSVGRDADDWWQGYLCGREEACEHVIAAEEDKQYAIRTEEYWAGRYLDEVEQRHSAECLMCELGAENGLLRHMAGLEGEDV